MRYPNKTSMVLKNSVVCQNAHLHRFQAFPASKNEHKHPPTIITRLNSSLKNAERAVGQA